MAEEPNAPVIEYVPSLVVFTRKQGTGRRRARICACGNFISSTAATEYEGPRSLSRHSLYAPGLDSTTFRCQARHAAYMVWIIAGLDISKAFLTAPMNRAQREGRLVVVQPPRAAVKLGLCTKEERWIVRKALYGLAESPAAWVEWRDQRLQGMSWVSKEGQAMSFQRSNADPSLFLIMAQEKPEGASKLVGTMGLYVDDFLMAGTMTVLREALEQIRKEWKTSEPEFCGPGCGDGFLKFLGVQIWYRNGSFFLNQEDFVRDLLNRRGYQIDETGKGSNLPMVKETPVVWGDCPVMWATQRQSTVALSTAEAELHASIEGATMIQSCTPIIAALVGTGEESLQKCCIQIRFRHAQSFNIRLEAGGQDT